MLTLSGFLLRFSTWPTKCCKKYYQHSVLIFARLSQHFLKYVKLCFRPLSGFVIPHVKILEWGVGGGGVIYWNCCVLVTVSSCICLPGFVQRYPLNSSTFSIQTGCSGESSWAGVSCTRIGIFKVKVTIRACIIMIWLFQLLSSELIFLLFFKPNLVCW